MINLKTSVEKRKNMEMLLNDLNLRYEIFDAVKGSEADEKEYKVNLRWYEPYNHRHMTYGEVGCALSHYSLWKKMIDENIDEAIILEDDVVINNPKLLQNIQSIKNNSYDFVYLGRKKMTDMIEETCEDMHSDLIRPGFSYWTCGYLISRSGANKLCDERYLNNLIAIDEYIPYMYGASEFYHKNSIRLLDESYKEIRDSVGHLDAYAFEPQMVSPNTKAFSQSSTFHSEYCSQTRDDVVCLSIATDKNDCYMRYIDSCEKYGASPVVMGLNRRWSGGNMKKGPGGGQKINLLREFLESQTENKLLIFTDNYDVIMNDHINIMIDKYNEMYKGKIVFGCETSCWPDTSLSERYPEAPDGSDLKYLNSGVFMGYSDDIKEIIKKPISNSDDDQLYYTIEFLENTNVVLDYSCSLFLCLNGITDRININKSRSCIDFNGDRPCFIHGNGPESIKTMFNNIITNYCMSYNSTYQYPQLKYDVSKKIIMVLHENKKTDNYDYFNGILNQDYPKDRLHIFVIYKTDQFLKDFDSVMTDESSIVTKIKVHSHDNNYKLWETICAFARNIEYDKLLYCSNMCMLTNRNCLQQLISQNKRIISPLLKESNSWYSNFWADLDVNGFYKRGSNYFDIVKNDECGCWNVPYISSCILMDKTVVQTENFRQNEQLYTDTDMIFCSNVRNNYDFMYILNTEEWGYLSYEVTLDTILSNKQSWEDKYLNTNAKNNNWNSEVIGENIHKLHMFNETFCNEIIQLAEEKSNWSQGGERHYDERIGNYENHPTQDIQLYDIGLDAVWKEILDSYISPFIWKEYKYSTKEPNLSFVVKYSMDGQKELNPHHDSSVYTVNICLNDSFSGGGCRFIRQDHSVVNKDIGSIVIHPGKLTHYHEGLPITDGTRYILISFVN